MWSFRPRQLGTLTLSDLLRPEETTGIIGLVGGIGNNTMGLMNGALGPNLSQILGAGNAEAQRRMYGRSNDASRLAMLLRGEVDNANNMGVFY